MTEQEELLMLRELVKQQKLKLEKQQEQLAQKEELIRRKDIQIEKQEMTCKRR